MIDAPGVAGDYGQKEDQKNKNCIIAAIWDPQIKQKPAQLE
ncbi:hypothetical protein [Brenneria izadpanahii]|nr:hypothetical protein [Brenneria izadpanahii]